MSIQAIITGSSEVGDQVGSPAAVHNSQEDAKTMEIAEVDVKDIEKLTRNRTSQSYQSLKVPHQGSSQELVPTAHSYISVHEADRQQKEENDRQNQNGDGFIKKVELLNQTSDQTASQEVISAKDINQQQIFVWGSNSSGQLGLKNGNAGHLVLPCAFNFHQRVQYISCGNNHSALVTFAKQLYVMGSNKQGQLGLGNHPSQIDKCIVPTLVQSLAHLQVLKVSCGSYHTLAICKEITGEKQSSVYAWGENSQGQTGVPDCETVIEPAKISFGDEEVVTTIDKISAGGEHSFLWDTTNWKVFACGESRQGQLGLGRCHEAVAPPKLVESLSQERIVEISAGDYHTLVINYEGRVFATGSNVTGQLGLGHTETQHEFQKIHELQNILQVSAGEHSAAIDCDGRLFRWGQGVKGVYLAPLKIASPRPTFIDQITMGAGFGIVRNKLGEIFSYGLNEVGQLGLGDNESRSTLNSMVQLNQQGFVKQVASGSNFAIALVDSRGGNLDSVDHLQVHESAPQPKPLVGNDRTSTTEFNEFHRKEMFVVMSERRPEENSRLGETGCFDERSIRLMRAMQGHHSFTANDFSSDLGTIQTAKEAKLSQAIRHEGSFQDNADYNFVNNSSVTNLRPLETSTRERPRQQLHNVSDMVPPYTTSPFNGQRKPEFSESTLRQASLERQSRDRLYNASGRDTRTHNDSRLNEPKVEVIDQSLADQYQLKSSFAQQVRPNFDKQSQNQYQGLEGVIPRNAVRRSLSPSRRVGAHNQHPSFSINAPNQFRSKTPINIPSGRRQYDTNVNQTNSSMENTGQFMSSFAHRMQESTARQNDSGHLRNFNHQEGGHRSSANTYAYANRFGQGLVPNQNTAEVQHSDELHSFDMTQPVYNSTLQSNFLTQQTSIEASGSGPVQRGGPFIYRHQRNNPSAISEELYDNEDGRYDQTSESHDDHHQQTNSDWKNQVISSRMDGTNPHQQVFDQSAQYYQRQTSRETSAPLRQHNRPVSANQLQNPVTFQRVATTDQNTYTPEDVKWQHQQQQMIGKHLPKTSQFDASDRPNIHQRHDQLRDVAAMIETESDEIDTQRVHKMPKSSQQHHRAARGSTNLYQPQSYHQSFDNRRGRSPAFEGTYNNSKMCKHHQQRFTTAQSSIQATPIGSVNGGHSHSYNHQHAATMKPPRPMSRSRSHSRCPMCRSEEQAENLANVNRCQQHCSCLTLSQLNATQGCHHGNSQHHQGETQQNPALQTSQTTTMTQSQQNLSKSQSRMHLDRKLKKKYKKLKQSASRLQMEHLAEKEKLKLRIHELQTELQNRHMNDRQVDIQKSEGYQQLVHKYTSEISVLQEQVCKLERTIVARESQLKIVNKDIDHHRNRAEKLVPELERLQKQNESLQEETRNMAEEVGVLKKNATEKDRTIELLSERLNAKTKACDQAEMSLRHLNKTFDDLKINFDGAKSHADSVMGDNDSLRVENNTLRGHIEVYEKQIENLRTFIDELEGNNKELVRYIDNRNLAQANEYKSKVSDILSKDRGYTPMNDAACLRAPSFAEDWETNFHRQSHNRSTNTNHFHETKSYSPERRHLISDNIPLLSSRNHQQVHHNQSTIQAMVPVSSLEQQLRVETSTKLSNKQQMSPDITQANNHQTNFMTQQHCVRKKSPRKISFEGDRSSHMNIFATNANLSPSANVSASQIRYTNLVEKEKNDLLQARQSLPDMINQIHRRESSKSPTGNYLVTKAGQLMEKALMYRQLASRQATDVSDPRDRLRGKKQNPGVAKFVSRSVSPGPTVISNRRQSAGSCLSRRSTISAGHNRSVAVSQNRSVENRSQGHFNSQDSLQVQYQVVSSLRYGNSLDKYQNEQNKLQSRLPDIRQVLQSSPGSRGRSNLRRPNQNATTQAVITEVAMNQEDGQDAADVAVVEEQKQVTVFPKVTSAMMRSQLENISMTLAELKRSRLQLNNGIQNYEGATQQQQHH